MSAEPEVRFRHHAVRDLAWVIASPGLLASQGDDRVSDSWCRIAYLDRLPWLRYQDHHPEELEGWLRQQHGRRLGHYFEALIAFWLARWPRMQLLASRLAVKEGQKTLGEFDFLFYDRHHQTYFHWESAVKFFLRHRLPDGEYAWLGPNPRDTLADKYRKVFQRQLQLGEADAARPLLVSRGITTLRPEAFFKGYLFYPAGSDWQEPQPMPPDSSSQHLRGWWCRAEALEQIPAIADDSRWLLLERLQWLSPAVSRDALPGHSRAGLLDTLSAHFAGSDRPLLLAELCPGGDDLWREVDRGFVVPAHWPHSRP